MFTSLLLLQLLRSTAAPLRAYISFALAASSRCRTDALSSTASRLLFNNVSLLEPMPPPKTLMVGWVKYTFSEKWILEKCCTLSCIWWFSTKYFCQWYVVRHGKFIKCLICMMFCVLAGMLCQLPFCHMYWGCQRIGCQGCLAPFSGVCLFQEPQGALMLGGSIQPVWESFSLLLI